MHSELVDNLRCLMPHEESWLVAAADETENRQIVRGVLGCPVCRTQYPIENGIADFRPQGARGPASIAPAAGVGDADPELALKVAAMLELTDASGFVLLAGAWGGIAQLLHELVPLHVLLVNPPAGVGVGGGVSALLTGERVPLATGSARGSAIDALGGIDPSAFSASMVAATRAGGRVAGPRTLPVPDGVALLAQDELHWVGTRTGGEPILKLVRAPR